MTVEMRTAYQIQKARLIVRRLKVRAGEVQAEIEALEVDSAAALLAQAVGLIDQAEARLDFVESELRRNPR